MQGKHFESFWGKMKDSSAKRTKRTKQAFVTGSPLGGVFFFTRGTTLNDWMYDVE